MCRKSVTRIGVTHDLRQGAVSYIISMPKVPWLRSR